MTSPSSLESGFDADVEWKSVPGHVTVGGAMKELEKITPGSYDEKLRMTDEQKLVVACRFLERLKENGIIRGTIEEGLHLSVRWEAWSEYLQQTAKMRLAGARELATALGFETTTSDTFGDLVSEVIAQLEQPQGDGEVMVRKSVEYWIRRADRAEADAVRLHDALQKNHEWHVSRGKDPESGYDLSAEYSDSTLCEVTEKALVTDT